MIFASLPRLLPSLLPPRVPSPSRCQAELNLRLRALQGDVRVKRLPQAAREDLAERAAAAVGGSSAARDGYTRAWRGFLGGVNEGRSVGLRQWFSRHCGGLYAAAALEAVLMHAPSVTDTEWRALRPLAQRTMAELKAQLPAWAVVTTDAHPHLPFWGRLSVALNNIAAFDPDDDDVVSVARALRPRATLCNTLQPPRGLPSCVANRSRHPSLTLLLRVPRVPPGDGRQSDQPRARREPSVAQLPRCSCRRR